MHKWLLILAGTATLAACGQTALERTATGAVIGGAAAKALGEDVSEGALYGGAAGAMRCEVAPYQQGCN